MELHDRAFIVTGGGSGLGRATVDMLAGAGARVGVLDVNAAAAEEAAARHPDQCLAVPVDVTDPDGLGRALDAVVARFGPLGGLVSCAGVVLAERVVGRQGPHDLSRFEHVVRVNLIGTFNAARLAAVRMRENPAGEEGERGVLVLTASIAAFEGQVGQAAYAASKGGVASLVLPLARELSRDGIRVVGIAPGLFDTPMMAALPEAARVSLGQQVPYPPRLGRPEEYAALVHHLLQNRMLNGSVVRLDGAMRMAPR